MMGSNDKILLRNLGIASAMVIIVIAVLSQTDIAETADNDQTCLTEQEIEDRLEFFNKECPVNFEDFRFESASECFEQKVTLFDPKICDL
ncbi:hypothetical protein [Nitrosopumilus cobalaminigenes]|uniref:hypothetical protein n=1 Tax=Nitrosopumilus cobalaminigenes TaxID=1470066 RepID=UPI0015CB918C|nr:hypothetical protein [Nitrosopumilus cobalaminigenes]